MNKHDVIEYIRNNSKHPHAALIAEWLLTGCEVEVWSDIQGDWILGEPSWDQHLKYRLVELKPAYRVYFDEHNGIPSTVDRNSDGIYSANYDENLNWLSDWIEYDPQPTVKWENIDQTLNASKLALS